MFRSPIARILLGVVVFIAALSVLRFKPWQRTDAANRTRQELAVGFLPVT